MTVEPQTFTDYFVTNSTSKTIVLSAIDIGGQAEAMLLTNSISVGQKAHIYSVVDGSGGNVNPSMLFRSFTVYSEIKDPGNIIYSKVEIRIGYNLSDIA